MALRVTTSQLNAVEKQKMFCNTNIKTVTVTTDLCLNISSFHIIYLLSKKKRKKKKAALQNGQNEGFGLKDS